MREPEPVQGRCPLEQELAEPEHEAKTRILLVPHGEVGPPQIIVEIAMDAAEQIRLFVWKIQQGGFPRRDQGRIQCLQDEGPLDSFVDDILVDRMQGTISPRNDLQGRDLRAQLGERPSQRVAYDRMKGTPERFGKARCLFFRPVPATWDIC